MQLLTVVRWGLEKTYQENPVGKKLQAWNQAQAPAAQLTRRNTLKKRKKQIKIPVSGVGLE